MRKGGVGDTERATVGSLYIHTRTYTFPWLCRTFCTYKHTHTDRNIKSLTSFCNRRISLLVLITAHIMTNLSETNQTSAAYFFIHYFFSFTKWIDHFHHKLSISMIDNHCKLTDRFYQQQKQNRKGHSVIGNRKASESKFVKLKPQNIKC